VALAIASGNPARAVIVATGDAASTAAAPTPDPGFSRLAIVAGLSGVHLGRGWVLTAGHVLATARNQKKLEVSIEGVSYRLLPETALTLSGDAGKADLALVRIADPPDASPLAITSQTPTPGTPLFLAGNGPRRGASRCWDAAGAPAKATGPGIRCGFEWPTKEKPEDPPTNAPRWGTNVVDGGQKLFPGPQGTRTLVFGTLFRPPGAGATEHEAQAGVGDSGGPVFVRDAGGSKLAGVMLGISAQRPRSAVFGDRTWIADLSAYRAQIERALASVSGGSGEGTPRSD
jgi:hypothetical protein